MRVWDIRFAGFIIYHRGIEIHCVTINFSGVFIIINSSFLLKDNALTTYLNTGFIAYIFRL